ATLRQHPAGGKRREAVREVIANASVRQHVVPGVDGAGEHVEQVPQAQPSRGPLLVVHAGETEGQAREEARPKSKRKTSEEAPATWTSGHAEIVGASQRAPDDAGFHRADRGRNRAPST